MTDSFYKIYSHYSKHQLLEILRNENEYQAEPVNAAKKIADEKRWTNEIESLLSKETLEEEQVIKEKAAYYKKAVEFQDQKNSFQVRIADVPKFEGALANAGMDYFKEDKNVGVLLDTYPTQTYYFKTDDLDKVDELTKSIGLRSATYVDPQPFFRFEFKVIFVVVIIVLIVIGIIKLRG
jgi:hypothetical protein